MQETMRPIPFATRSVSIHRFKLPLSKINYFLGKRPRECVSVPFDINPLGATNAPSNGRRDDHSQMHN